MALQETLINLAQRMTDSETNVHLGIAESMREVASELSRSTNPSILLSSLAAKFPDLKGTQGFSAAQASAVEIERELDAEVRAINRELGAWDELRRTIPMSLAASILGCKDLGFVSSDDISKGKIDLEAKADQKLIASSVAN